MRRRITNSHKAGASNHARPDPSSAGSHSAAQVSKIRALFDAMGGKPMIVRFSDDRTAVLSAHTLEFIPVHGAFTA